MKNLLMAMLLLPLMALADKEIVNDIEWTYSVNNGEAWIDSAASTNQIDSIVIPSMLGGCLVTSIGKNWFDVGYSGQVFKKMW